MATYTKVFFKNTVVGDRIIFHLYEVDFHKVGIEARVYRRICQIGANINTILWLEQPGGTGRLVTYSPFSDRLVWVIKET